MAVTTVRIKRPDHYQRRALLTEGILKEVKGGNRIVLFPNQNLAKKSKSQPRSLAKIMREHPRLISQGVIVGTDRIISVHIGSLRSLISQGNVTTVAVEEKGRPPLVVAAPVPTRLMA